jgi:hypothetical protein
MPKQLSLLDDEDTSCATRAVTWSQLPEEVRATLSQRLAELLVRIVRPTAIDEEPSDDAP